MFSSLWLKSSLTLVCVALIVMGSCRMMKLAGCGARPPRPPRTHTYGPLDVIRAETGASLTVASGRRGKSEQLVIIADIAAPTSGKYASESQTSLADFAGATVMVTIKGRRGVTCVAADGDTDSEVYFSAMVFQDLQEESQEEALEARGPLVGVVVGASGINLAEAQLSIGMARCQSGASAELKKIEAKARAAKVGVWK